ncbi:MAG: hypothetical protein RLY93_19760 [Sumerlaeia bacterium]
MRKIFSETGIHRHALIPLLLAALLIVASRQAAAESWPEVVEANHASFATARSGEVEVILETVEYLSAQDQLSDAEERLALHQRQLKRGSLSPSLTESITARIEELTREIGTGYSDSFGHRTEVIRLAYDQDKKNYRKDRWQLDADSQEKMPVRSWVERGNVYTQYDIPKGRATIDRPATEGFQEEWLESGRLPDSAGSWLAELVEVSPDGFLIFQTTLHANSEYSTRVVVDPAQGYQVVERTSYFEKNYPIRHIENSDFHRYGSVWFPHRIEHRIGPMPGSHLPFDKQFEVRVQKAEFNIAIPEEEFDLLIPDGVFVIDRIGGVATANFQTSDTTQLMAQVKEQIVTEVELSPAETAAPTASASSEPTALAPASAPAAPAPASLAVGEVTERQRSPLPIRFVLVGILAAVLLAGLVASVVRKK